MALGGERRPLPVYEPKEMTVFDDKRSKKVVLVAHCILDQNSRISGCGLFPGAMGEAARVLVDSGVGLVQLPCPELLHLGLDRVRHEGSKIGVWAALSTPTGRQACKDMLQDVVCQIREYRKHGFEVLGVVGIDGSPACGVNLIWDHAGKKDVEGTGAFIIAMRELFAENGLDLEIVGARDGEWEEGVRRIRTLLAKGADGNRA
jgi:predicted secreted protein